MAGPKYDLVVLQDSPVAYWRLDEATVGALSTVVDSVGGRLATVRGDWRPGAGPTTQIVGAVETTDFDNGWLDAGTARILGTGPGVTVEMWARLRQPPYVQVTVPGPWSAVSGPLAGVVAASRPWGLTYSSDWRLAAPLVDAAVTTEAGRVGPGAWRHIVLTLGGGGSRIYVDGGLVAEQTGDPYSGTLDDLGLVHTLAGRASWGPLPLVAVSRVAFYDRELASNRVIAHYNARFGTDSTILPPLNSQYDNAVVADGATHYWRLDELSVDDGDSAGDSVGALTGIYQGAVTPTDGPTSALTRAVRLGGAGNGWVTLTGARLLSDVTAWSVECWIASDVLAADRVIVGLSPNVADQITWFLVQGADGRFRVGFNNNNVQTPSAFTLAVWHHVVWTYSTAGHRLYVDGVDSGLTSAESVPHADDLGRTKALGKHQGNGTYWSGRIGRVAYYPLALSSAQVADHWDKRLTVAAPVDLRDGAMALGRAWLNSAGQLDTVADLLYEILGYVPAAGGES